MRILAIRGCNLASLAGEFEIDLARGALAGAGVFAIVGPTGAGKSTLLDAMCVALFDRTPRLTNRSTVVVGRGDEDPTALGAQDVRSLLRRGASTGWAEVDFESGDARRYRARWSVRRARGASDGRFQNQQVTLTTIDGGEQLGGTKTETLEAIHQRLGLSFDQFRRSALLAQGEFAAFLRADGKDRSELLERMTGTEIYTQLSIAAHHRAALAEQQLRERQAVALAIAVLSDDERVGIEHELGLANHAREASRARLAEAEAAARWFAEAKRLGTALGEAEAAQIAAQQAADSASAQRAELAVRRRAETLRARWQDVARLDRQHAIAQGQGAATSEAVARAETTRRQVAAERARLVELHTPVRDARIAAGLVERSHVTSSEDLDVRAVAAGRDAAWLLARRELAGAIAGWRDLDDKLAQQAALAEDIAHADRMVDDHVQRRNRLVAQRAGAAGEHQQATGRLADAQREASAFQQQRGLSLDAARRHEDEARLRCGELEHLVVIAGEARAATTVLGELERQLAELDRAAAAGTGERRALETERDTAATVREERARIVVELRKAVGYEHARAELVAGEPCPLCGATDHPWHARGSFDVLITEAEARFADAVARGEAAVASLATSVAREQHRSVERTRLAESRATAAAGAGAAQRAWRHRLAALGELLLVDDPASPAAQQLAAERVAAARAQLAAARTARSQAEAVAKAGAEAHALVQTRQADVEQHAHQLRELDAALATIDGAIERVRGERASKLDRHGEIADAIASGLGPWDHPALAASQRRVIANARQSSTGLTDRGRVAAELGEARRVAAEHREGRRVAADGEARRVAADGEARRVVAALGEARRVVAELARAWTAHAGVVADVDSALAHALVEIDDVAREAVRAVTEQLAHREAALARRDAVQREHADASAALALARDAAGFAIDELDRLLASDEAGIDTLAVHLEGLDRAVDRARTLVAERRRRVEHHRATRPPFAAADMVERPDVGDGASMLAGLAAAVTAADHRAAALAARLAGDAEARARRAGALAELAAAEHVAEVDQVLGEVIGSHDGKLFRSFAQSLTLDSLLAVANSHLEELAPRYQLERVPKHDLELQVIDRELGNEVRSVQSLSGGESFLVSLALALGLSSMSAHDVRVRTLLIDEGFGTLDPATLDSALAVLDTLQSTGRQVGIISHVPALVDRVGAHVRVDPKGGGRSEVVVAEC